MEFDIELAREAFTEAFARYPEAERALAFLWVASGVGINYGEPTPEQIEEAKKFLKP